ncbi:BlaI/MecI/CopY family transcriptional regulator [Candidatus Sumerlaeota bacterium]|nr:BlaI/MecI/CopY family transcriptional regulator [Candidatus Sumerlaeota bacterium]
MNRNFPDLSDAEWIVMKKIWELGKTNVREVYEELKSSQNWAYNTVRTMMERLRSKGYLSVKKIGNTHFYTPNVSRNKITRKALFDFIDRVFDGAVGSVMSHLVNHENLSDSEIDKIRDIVNREGKK